MHKSELDGIEDQKDRADRFVELNVIEQVHDLATTNIIRNAWSKEDSPKLHGWVYDIKNGLIQDLEV